MYVGASVAVGVFDEVPPESVAWLRIVATAVVLAIVTRPWRDRWSRHELISAGAFGVAIAGMNVTFYLALARVHLGSTVAIEFIGPIAVAAWTARSRAAVSALALAGGGVALLGVGLSTDWIGVAWALAAGACWGGYVVLGAAVSGQRGGAGGLAVAMAFAAIVAAPVGAPGSESAWTSVRLLVLCAAVGLLSSLVPYAIDQHVLRRVSRGEFATMLAILPVTATVVGRVGLAQRPRWFEVVGIVAVVIGLVVQARTAKRIPGPLAANGPNHAGLGGLRGE